MGEEHYDWWAMIGIQAGPDPAGVITAPHDKSRHLAEVMQLGDLVLAPAERPFTVWRRSVPHSVNGWTEIEHWPIFLVGRGEPTPRIPFNREVASLTRQCAALIALSWREPWHVLQAPTTSLRARVPDSDSPPFAWMEREDRLWPPEQTPLPSWFGKAWDVLAREPQGLHALLSWHEGLLVESSHPSLALLAYTAAVEAAAGICLGRRKSDRQGPDRFRVMIDRLQETGSVIPVDWYKLRSGIAHNGRLPGLEASVGALFDLGDPLSSSAAPAFGTPEGEFVLRTVPQARMASARAVEQALDVQNHT